MNDREHIVNSLLGPEGRMLSSSKTEYFRAHPDHDVIFNANVYDSLARKLWWGDIDKDVDMPVLLGVADVLGESIYVARENAFDSRSVTVIGLQAACMSDARLAFVVDPPKA